MAAKCERNNQMKQVDDTGKQSDANKRQNLQDSFCWLCHRNNANVNCSMCIRSYHIGCIGRSQSPEGHCETCFRLDLANLSTVQKYSNVEYLNQLLLMTTKRLLDDQEFNGFSQHYYESHRNAVEDCGIVNPIDLESIYEKAYNSKYKSTIDFMNDIKWICHNVHILDENKNNLRISKRLDNFCMKEIYDIEMCHQCYYRSNTQSGWFTTVCDPPHLLVWARINGHSGYAPAKVLGLSGGGGVTPKKVDVRFFADHEMAIIPSSNCYLFSQRKPIKKTREQTQLKLMTALQEVDIYIENIQETHQKCFSKAAYRTPFVEHKIVEHLRSMIPGLHIPSDFQLTSKPSYLNRLFRRHAPIALPPNDANNSTRTCSSPVASVDLNCAQNSIAHENATLQLSLNPTVIIEKCDALLTKQRQSVNVGYSKDVDTDEMQIPANQETNIIECAQITRLNQSEGDVIPSKVATAENRTSNAQNSSILISITVEPSNKISDHGLNDTLRSRNNDGIVFAKKKSDLLQTFNSNSIGVANMVEISTSTPEQPIAFQPINQVKDNGHAQNENRLHLPENIEVNQSVIDGFLPLSTSNLSDKVATNCDWMEILENYQNRIEKRQRINRKKNLKREEFHVKKMNQLKSIVKTLKKKNHKLQMNMHKVGEQQNERLKSMIQNAIEETKRKKWCWNCHMELTFVVPNIPVCKTCLSRNWLEHNENADETSDPVEQVENISVAPNHVFVEESVTNEDHQQFNTDQLLADLNDPLCLELEGF